MTTKIERTITYVKETAGRFGAKDGAYVFRNNTKNGADDESRAYFGFVQPDEPDRGQYSDFSLVLFPGGDDQKWIVELGVGSEGFRNDLALATFPGFRRLFVQLVDRENGFCKSDFSDISTRLPSEFVRRDDLQHLSNTINYYSPYFSACQVIDDPEDQYGRDVISAFIAAYAQVRQWPNKGQQKEVDKALKKFVATLPPDSADELTALVAERRFVVIQGAPGTGKTRSAKIIAQRMKAKVFFTQFHAETSYSDFVHGIAPNLEQDVLLYQEREGVLLESIRFAISNPGTPTVLIIDEINRANLSNVLGPVFYLFEHKMEDSEVSIALSSDLSVKSLPENFFVIATMNTADRSLAVVDFALRRRFAWYTLRPVPIKSNSDSNFFGDDFRAFEQIFNWHASSEELSLQPGQGYFIATDANEMTNRVKYELYPLIREYLQEGLMRTAKEEFNNYFLQRIGQQIFE